MMQNPKEQAEKSQSQVPPVPPRRPPNDVGAFNIMGFVKIHDPNTREVFVEKRA